MNNEITLAEKRLFYRVDGQGRPVMLVHGFGETANVWARQVEYLNDHFRIIVPDLPGSGDSEMVNDMSIEGMAEALKAIIDQENLGDSSNHRWCIIGHSMGGYITLALAEKYPSLLSSFGLFHSTSYPDTEEKKAARRKGIGFIQEHGAFEFLKTTSPNLFSPKTRENNPGLVDKFIQGLGNLKPAALIAYYEAMINRPARTDIIKNFSRPVLFAMGEHDNAVPFEDSLKQSHLPQIAFVHIMHESGHMGMLEEPGKTNELLLEFLKNN